MVCYYSNSICFKALKCPQTWNHVQEKGHYGKTNSSIHSTKKAYACTVENSEVKMCMMIFHRSTPAFGVVRRLQKAKAEESRRQSREHTARLGHTVTLGLQSARVVVALGARFLLGRPSKYMMVIVKAALVVVSCVLRLSSSPNPSMCWDSSGMNHAHNLGMEDPSKTWPFHKSWGLTLTRALVETRAMKMKCLKSASLTLLQHFKSLSLTLLWFTTLISTTHTSAGKILRALFFSFQKL